MTFCLSYKMTKLWLIQRGKNTEFTNNSPGKFIDETHFFNRIMQIRYPITMINWFNVEAKTSVYSQPHPIYIYILELYIVFRWVHEISFIRLPVNFISLSYIYIYIYIYIYTSLSLCLFVIYLMAYKPSRAIYCQIHPSRMTVVVLFNP